MQIIRIAADTQLAYAVPITIYGARLQYQGATTAAIYDQAGATPNSPTDTCKRIGLETLATYKSTDDALIPAGGVKFSAGCYVEFNAGEVFLTID